jgi:hypothetical protein
MNWNIEDIIELNPSEDGRRRFLEHLLRTRVASAAVLCTAAERLEALGRPWVAAFTTLPYGISTSPFTLQTFGTSSDKVVELSYTPMLLLIDDYGAANLDAVPTRELGDDDCLVTLVTAYVQLWGPRVALHSRYSEAGGTPRFHEKVFGNVQHWMDLPEAQLAEPRRHHAELKAEKIRAEIANRLRYEVLAATNRIARVVSVETLQRVPELRRVFGYFAMITPGEIANAGVPRPVQTYFYRKTLHSLSAACVDAIRASAKSSTEDISAVRRGDPMISQLIAMNELSRQGESGLALLGAVAALEWFLNERFPNIARTNADGRKQNASLHAFSKATESEFLGTAYRTRLSQLAHLRNRVAHGLPDAKSMEGIVADEPISVAAKQEMLLFILEVYRTVNRFLSQ